MNASLRMFVFIGACVVLISLNTHASRNNLSARNGRSLYISELHDLKEWKKLTSTKSNVLIFFSAAKPSEHAKQTLNILYDASEMIKGIGTIASVYCTRDNRKLCKKLKAFPDDGHYVLKHYHNGNFNKEYDRQVKVSSVISFMKDPTGDIPWEEETLEQDVLHFPAISALLEAVKKEASSGKRILVLLYAPWCRFCKTVKPEFLQAAVELRGEAILGAIDVNKPENSDVREKFNITGFPTFLYFCHGHLKQQYEGETSKSAFVSFLRDPLVQHKRENEIEKKWSDEPSEVFHLYNHTFEEFLQVHPSVLVMFYAPWCGHCKIMKHSYNNASKKLKDNNIAGVLAAVDGTNETEIARKFDVKAYPTIKYFKNAIFMFDSNVRDEESIFNLMKNPKEPPPSPAPEKHWSEETSAVVHLDEDNFNPILRKKKNALVLFYAPWCVYCKRVKPEFIAAANDLQDDPKVLFAAVDCTLHDTLCKIYNVQGFPTFKKFHYLNKQPIQDYDGGRQKYDMIKEMASTVKADSRNDWAEITGQEYVHKFSENNHQNFLDTHKSVLLMFYTPWCGHCKSLKTEFALAASNLAITSSEVDATFAACNCEDNPKMTGRFQISGYPTILYFQDGKRMSEYSQGRKSSELISFMTQVTKKKDEL